jgi:hypothetical protein
MLLVMVGWQQPAAAGARVGKPIPWFKLEDLVGKRFSKGRLRGRPAVLVVGRSQRAAPPCKKWILEIIKRHGMKLPVYQVIVVDKSWFIPRSLVIDKVKEITPRNLRHRILLEWYTVFADTYGIPTHDEPVVLVTGPDSVLRWRHKGPPTRAAIERLTTVLRSIKQ